MPNYVPKCDHTLSEKLTRLADKPPVVAFDLGNRRRFSFIFIDPSCCHGGICRKLTELMLPRQ
jgi:hypothetical protein